MSELNSMSIRDLIAALADAEDASRRVRRTVAASSAPDNLSRRLAGLAAQEEAIVAELHRRSAEYKPSVA